MAPILRDTGLRAVPVVTGWECCATPAGAAADPSGLGPGTAWHPARVPGTAASAFEAAGLWRREEPTPVHDRDVWFRVELPETGAGARRLRFGGLATIAEVWLDGRRILDSDDAFLTHEVAVELPAGSRLHIGFRSLAAHLATCTGRRARWRTWMIPDQRLRFCRTPLLGHMPGWTPAIDLVGPWRPVEILVDDEPPLRNLSVRPSLEGETGRLEVAFDLDGSAPSHRSADRQGPHAEVAGTAGPRSTQDGRASFEARLRRAPQDEERRNFRPGEVVGTLQCAGRSAPIVRDAAGRFAGTLLLPGIAPWWPHAYGKPVLHPVAIELAGGRRIELSPVGFRDIRLDRGADGRDFRLLVNGVPVFCRGASWLPPDIVDPGREGEALARSLELARRAGVTMLRISGATIPPPPAFHDLCDRLGILVWHDLMLANFDYPLADPAFVERIGQEVAQTLSRLQASPSLAILCGGSEVAQQAAMMGLPSPAWASPALDAMVEERIAAIRPGTAYVASSPSGGDLPFAADAGCTHYYGVGAYRRPPEDARRAGVRFASECLAFANLPEPATLQAGPALPAVHHPDWKAGVPRDLGAPWDFEDVRDHYTGLLYGVDPARLRTEDPERYLQLSRAAVAEVAERTLAEWRRPGSGTHGALLWTWQDLRPGAGWGLLDVTGRPKSIWYGLARASQPTALLLTDEGVNGLHLHLVHDGPEPLRGTLSLACLRDGRLPVASGRQAIALAPRSGLSVSSAALLGRFFDVTYAYRFGPADHDCCHAVLTGEDGQVIAEATFWLPGRRTAARELGLRAEIGRDEAGWHLTMSSDRMAACVAIDDEVLVPAESYLDLAPGRPRIVRLEGDAPPSGRITALNGLAPVRY